MFLSCGSLVPSFISSHTLTRGVRKCLTACLATGPFMKTPVSGFAVYANMLQYFNSSYNELYASFKCPIFGTKP